MKATKYALGWKSRTTWATPSRTCCVWSRRSNSGFPSCTSGRRDPGASTRPSIFLPNSKARTDALDSPQRRNAKCSVHCAHSMLNESFSTCWHRLLRVGTTSTASHFLSSRSAHEQKTSPWNGLYAKHKIDYPFGSIWVSFPKHRSRTRRSSSRGWRFHFIRNTEDGSSHPAAHSFHHSSRF